MTNGFERRLPVQVTPRGVAGSLLVLLVAAVCVRLGFWQLDRLEQKQASNAVLATRMEAEPLLLEGDVRDTVGLRYRRVTAYGEWDGAHSIVLPGRAYQGSPGAHVLTPLRLADGSAVLVNRGWVGAADAATVPDSLFRLAGTDTVEGQIEPFPGHEASLAARAAPVPSDGAFRRAWFAIDEPALRAQFPYPLVDVAIRWLPAEGVRGPPVRLAPPLLDEGPHLGYAIQWFAFAAIAIIGWLAMILRRERR